MFIEASRKFVCIRIETYENKASEMMVRSILGGPFANTAFVVFAPDGTRRLSRSGRSPSVLAPGRSGEDLNAVSVAAALDRIASGYEASASSGTPLLQDFDSFRQALNVASADQRLLVVVNSARSLTRNRVRHVLSTDEMRGVFHTDRVDAKADEGWHTSINVDVPEPGILIVRSGQFGVTGQVMARLDEDATTDEITAALRTSNATFAAVESRKNFAQHAAAGRRQGIYFENEIPYGEDRDGDGVIDRQERSSGADREPSGDDRRDRARGERRRQSPGGTRGRRGG